MHEDSRCPVAQLTTRELDLYGNQLTRCLKALGTQAPIRADIQRELATVRTEQESRATPASPDTPAAGDQRSFAAQADIHGSASVRGGEFAVFGGLG
jgi:hypothetical protein